MTQAPERSSAAKPRPARQRSEAERFKLQEHKLLRREIEQRAHEQRLMERYVVLGNASIYGVVFFKLGSVNQPEIADTLYWWLLLLPPIISFLALIRWRESLEHIAVLALYLQLNEQVVTGGKNGWELFLSHARENRLVPLKSRAADLFWSCVTAGPASFLVYQWRLSTHQYVLASAIIAFLAVAIFVILFLGRPLIRKGLKEQLCADLNPLNRGPLDLSTKNP